MKKYKATKTNSGYGQYFFDEKQILLITKDSWWVTYDGCNAKRFSIGEIEEINKKREFNINDFVGKYFQTKSGARFMLCQTEAELYKFISLDNGNRYSPILCGLDLTLKEFKDAFGFDGCFNLNEVTIWIKGNDSCGYKNLLEYLEENYENY